MLDCLLPLRAALGETDLAAIPVTPGMLAAWRGGPVAPMELAALSESECVQIRRCLVWRPPATTPAAQGGS